MKSLFCIAALFAAGFALPAQAHGRSRHHHWHRVVRHVRAVHGWRGRHSGHSYSHQRVRPAHGLRRLVERVSPTEVAWAAAANRVPLGLAQRIIRVESGGRCAIPGGGVMQVKARTARSMGVYGDLRSCGASLSAGMRYLRAALDLARGDWAAAATLYNRGLGARPTGRSRYAAMAMGYWRGRR